jgi:putative phosphoesterase
VRIALISDQHANDVAFAAVADDIARVGVDRIVCLGDTAQGGPQPARTLDRLAELGCETVLGNSDAFLLDVDAEPAEQLTEEVLEVREWTLTQLEERHVEQIRAWPETIELPLDGARVICFHASPRSYHDVLLPEGEETDVEPWRVDADVLAGGHTHRQWTREIDRALYVNPGSVGLVYDHHQPEDSVRFDAVAQYAILYVSESGAGVDFRQVPYSLTELREALLRSGRPHADEFAAQYSDLPR